LKKGVVSFFMAVLERSTAILILSRRNKRSSLALYKNHHPQNSCSVLTMTTGDWCLESSTWVSAFLG